MRRCIGTALHHTRLALSKHSRVAGQAHIKPFIRCGIAIVVGVIANLQGTLIIGTARHGGTTGIESLESALCESTCALPNSAALQGGIPFVDSSLAVVVGSVTNFQIVLQRGYGAVDQCVDFGSGERPVIHSDVVHFSTPPGIVALAKSTGRMKGGSGPVHVGSRGHEISIEVHLHGIGGLVPGCRQMCPCVVGKIGRGTKCQVVCATTGSVSESEIEGRSIPFKETQPIGGIHTTVGLEDSIALCAAARPIHWLEPERDGPAFVVHSRCGRRNIIGRPIQKD